MNCFYTCVVDVFIVFSIKNYGNLDILWHTKYCVMVTTDIMYHLLT